MVVWEAISADTRRMVITDVAVDAFFFGRGPSYRSLIVRQIIDPRHQSLYVELKNAKRGYLDITHWSIWSLYDMIILKSVRWLITLMARINDLSDYQWSVRLSTEKNLLRRHKRTKLEGLLIWSHLAVTRWKLGLVWCIEISHASWFSKTLLFF